jgi:hypothetical protein
MKRPRNSPALECCGPLAASKAHSNLPGDNNQIGLMVQALLELPRKGAKWNVGIVRL